MDMTERLVRDAPFERMETGLKAVVELTAYPKSSAHPNGFAAIAVSKVEGPRHARTIRHADGMTLNSTEELRRVVGALIDRLEEEA